MNADSAINLFLLPSMTDSERDRGRRMSSGDLHSFSDVLNALKHCSADSSGCARCCLVHPCIAVSLNFVDSFRYCVSKYLIGCFQDYIKRYSVRHDMQLALSLVTVTASHTIYCNTEISYQLDHRILDIYGTGLLKFRV